MDYKGNLVDRLAPFIGKLFDFDLSTETVNPYLLVGVRAAGGDLVLDYVNRNGYPSEATISLSSLTDEIIDKIVSNLVAAEVK